MHTDCNDLLKLLWQEVLFQDSYQVRNLVGHNIPVILDLGANVGTFSILARMLFPTARILAFEPYPPTMKLLELNTLGLGIELYPLALGSGSPISLIDGKMPTGSGSVYGQPEASGQTATFTLAQLLQQVGLDSLEDAIVKCDCEGGEVGLYNQSAIELLKPTTHFAAEIHGFPWAPSPSDWQRWLYWGTPRATAMVTNDPQLGLIFSRRLDRL